MPHAAFYALLAWTPFMLLLFRLVPVRQALLVNFLAGWMLLPGADYIDPHVDFPYWILSISLPSSFWMTKGTITGLAALAGVIFFHRDSLKAARPRMVDLPICLWCLAPLGPVLTHPWQGRLALCSVAYLALSWGVPWATGRLFFSSDEEKQTLVRGLIAASLLYLPFCLYELVKGPTFYELFYYYQPYQMIGAKRYLGQRPIGWMEDGNQLGIWMAATAWLAISLAVWKKTAREKSDNLWRISPRLQAVLLGISTLLWQSAGAIVLLVCLLPSLAPSRRLRSNWLRIVTLALLVVLFAASVAALIAEQDHLIASLQSSRFTQFGVRLFNSVGRHSLVWRLHLETIDARLALSHPLFGTGEWDWWRTRPERPWSLWFLVMGMYGLAGTVALGSALLIPILRAARHAAQTENWTAMAIAGAAWMLFGDSFFNGAFPLPLVLLFGASAAIYAQSKGVLAEADSSQAQRHP